MLLYKDTFNAYDLTLMLRIHIKVKYYNSTYKSYIGNDYILLPELVSSKKRSKKTPFILFL
jgi:hypothetical protein